MVAVVVVVSCGDAPPKTDDEQSSAAEGGSSDGADDAGGDASPSATTSGGEAEMPGDGAVTYHRDVRPVLERHCVGCHSDGQIAPYSLTNYDEVWPLREAIATAVSERTMPPWNPAQGCAEYLNDPSLPEDAIGMLQTWVDGDGPVGDPSDYVAPEVPEPEGISRVDHSLTVPEPYLPAQFPDDYRCFLLDWPETETSYITGFQVVPDNLETVHHVITYAIEPDAVAAFEQLDADDPGPGYTCFGGPGGGGSDWTSGRWLGAWAPGGKNTDFPEGVGLKMEPGSKVVVQIHYNAAEDSQPDQTTVDYKVDPSVEREAYMMPWADPDWLSGSMHIPAGAESTVYTWELDPTVVMSFITDAIPGFQPFLMYSASHHMHLRGVRGTQIIKRADGTEECLVDIPNYDFNWQTRYRFAEPKVFNPGDRLTLQCEWDNRDGDTALNWGEGTGDEMCLGVYFIAPLP